MAVSASNLLALCVPASTMGDLTVDKQTALATIVGPKLLRLGTGNTGYVFHKMENMPVWKCNEPAYKYNAAQGMVMYLFKFAVAGVWLCAHGPKNIDNYDAFWAACDDGTLKPVWGSWDRNGILPLAVGESGCTWAAWDTFDTKTGHWVGENYHFKALELEPTDCNCRAKEDD